MKYIKSFTQFINEMEGQESNVPFDVPNVPLTMETAKKFLEDSAIAFHGTLENLAQDPEDALYVIKTDKCEFEFKVSKAENYVGLQYKTPRESRDGEEGDFTWDGLQGVVLSAFEIEQDESDTHNGHGEQE